MKTYNITKRISKQARQQLERIVRTHEKYQSCYFWKPAQLANQRRSNEDKFTANNPDVLFIMGDNQIVVSQKMNETCKNVYYRLDVYVNGVKKGITTIKKILNK